MLLPSAVNVALLASPKLFAREDIVITGVSTLAEETTSYIVVDGQTEETVVTGSPSVVEVAGATTTVEFSPVNTHTQADETTISVEIEPQPLKFGDFAFTGELNGTPFTEIAPFATTWTYPGTLLGLSIPSRQTAFVFTGEASTEITVPPEHTHLTIDGMETHVDLPGLTTVIDVTDSTNIILQLPATTTTMEIGAETFEFTVHPQIIGGDDYLRFCGTDAAQTLTDHSRAGIGGPCVAGTTFAVTLPSHRHVLYLHAPGTTAEFTLPGITTTFVPEQTITIVRDSSSIETIIPAEVSTYVTTISDTDIFPEVPSDILIGLSPKSTDGVMQTIVFVGPDTTWTLTADGPITTTLPFPTTLTSDGSVITSETSLPTTISSSGDFTISVPTNLPSPSSDNYMNTACDVIVGLVSGEDVALLDVIFTGTIDGTTYAQWLVNYASELTRQIDNVAAQAVSDTGRQYTTAFDTINVAGILDLASAAPMYTCYLSSLWAEALRNPSAYAKRGSSNQDGKTKLIVLFERRDNNNGASYDLAELLVDETNDLITEMNAVIGSGANPSNYANLFNRLNVKQLLSIASEAPVYTSGLSAAFQTALASYSATARGDA